MAWSSCLLAGCFTHTRVRTCQCCCLSSPHPLLLPLWDSTAPNCLNLRMIHIVCIHSYSKRSSPSAPLSKCSIAHHSTSPAHKPSSWELKTQTRVRVSNRAGWFTCLMCTVTCVHPLQVAVCLTEQGCGEDRSTESLLQAQESRSSGNVAGTTVFFKVLCYKTAKNFFVFVCLSLLPVFLCEKYYKPIIVQYYIADCVSWIPGLTLLDLTNWIYRCTLFSFIFISWRLITLQHCSGFYHTLT